VFLNKPYRVDKGTSVLTAWNEVAGVLSKEAVFSEYNGMDGTSAQRARKAPQKKMLQKLVFGENDWLSSQSEEEPPSELERIILDIFNETDETVHKKGEQKQATAERRLRKQRRLFLMPQWPLVEEGSDAAAQRDFLTLPITLWLHERTAQCHHRTEVQPRDREVEAGTHRCEVRSGSKAI
jgi:hypothetical protein